jgi:hypothetical protein
MRAVWHASELRCSAEDTFRLSPSESQRIRLNALARVALR